MHGDHHGRQRAKLDRARELGADHTIDHYKQKISEEVKKITAKQGVDMVFEHVGQATWVESIKSLKPGGTLVTCGATSGFEGSIDLRVLFARQLNFLGSFMGNMGEFHEVLKHVLRPIEAGGGQDFSVARGGGGTRVFGQQ